MNRFETIGTIKNVLKTLVLEDLEDFYTFQRNKIEIAVKCAEKDMKLTLKTYVDCNDRVKLKMDPIASENLLLNGMNDKTEQLFIAKYNVSIELIKMYLHEVKAHRMQAPVLPVLLEYLLFVNVTSVSSERNFSKLKRIFGTDRHSLKDESAFNELLIKQLMTTSDVDWSYANLTQGCISGL